MILILGMPGSGKTTQTQRLGEYLDCPWFSTGELIREKATGENREIMLQGKLIADEPTMEILSSALAPLDLVNTQCVVEGNPRSIPQAQWWIKRIEAGQIKFTGLVHLVISEKDAEDRLRRRHRVDDEDIAVLKRRFAEYHRNISPTMDYLKKNGIEAKEVDAAQDIDKVAADIRKAVGV